MESLVQQQLPGVVHFGGEAGGLGCEDVHACRVVLVAVPTSDIVLSNPNGILSERTIVNLSSYNGVFE